MTEMNEFSSTGILAAVKQRPMTIRNIVDSGYSADMVYDDLAYLYSKGMIQMDIKHKEICFETEVQYG